MAENLEVWNAELLRITVFFQDPMTERGLDIWDSLIDEEPQVKIEEPRKRVRKAEGLCHGVGVVVETQQGRLDVRLYAPEPNMPTPDGFNILGPYPDAKEHVKRLAQRLLVHCSLPPLQRLAFGAVLQQHVDSREAGYRKLDDYLHFVKMDPENSSDFVFRINRPRNSTVQDIEVNRLSKWTIPMWVLHRLQGGVDPKPKPIGKPQFACRLELDINTDGAFSGRLDRPYDLFLELMALGEEIAIKGDIQ